MIKRVKTYYQILGLHPDCSAFEIKRAYRKLAKAQHPDLGHKNKNETERQQATEEMLILNEAYAVLSDQHQRTQYDIYIGTKASFTQSYKFAKTTEDEERRIFLASVFHPTRKRVLKILSHYKKQLNLLTQDIYDDQLIEQFEHYVDEIKNTLSDGSKAFTQNVEPPSLSPAVHLMRHSIAQAVDGLDELYLFFRNYNYHHLLIAQDLFNISCNLARQSLSLTKII